MLKGELGVSLTAGVATAGDQEFYTLIDDTQKWLASEYDWPFLRSQADIAVAGGTGDATRYPTAPTTINFERPVKVETLWSTYWHPVDFGIGTDQYNQLSSGDGGVAVKQLNPIQRWDWKTNDSTKLEIWPLPTDAQTLRFRGQAILASLKDGSGAFDSTKTLDLDDLLVVLFAAAGKLARMRKEDSRYVLSKAEARLNRLKASYPVKSTPFVLGGAIHAPPKRVVPIVTVA